MGQGQTILQIWKFSNILESNIMEEGIAFSRVLLTRAAATALVTERKVAMIKIFTLDN